MSFQQSGFHTSFNGCNYITQVVLPTNKSKLAPLSSKYSQKCQK